MLSTIFKCQAVKHTISAYIYGQDVQHTISVYIKCQDVQHTLSAYIKCQDVQHTRGVWGVRKEAMKSLVELNIALYTI